MDGKRTVLVIEDVDFIRDALCSVLESDGFEVVGCGDGRSALAAAAEKKFDVIITDYRMPHVTGVEVTRILRERMPGSIIIGVSSDNKQHDFLTAGANAFLLKPYVFDDLADLIR